MKKPSVKKETKKVEDTPEEEPKILIKGDAFISVEETVLGKRKEDIKFIKIKPFVTDTARVEVHAKRHIPLGMDVGNITVAVTISSPCYNEEISTIYNKLDGAVDKIMENKITKIMESLEKTKEEDIEI